MHLKIITHVLRIFFLNNGFTLPEQEQVAEATNEEEEQNTPSVKENKPAPPTPTEEIDTGQIPILSGGNNSNVFKNHQFFPLNEEETKYKESKENFHISLRNDVIEVVITGLFIAAAVMVPSIAGAVVCGIVAALALVATGLHVKDSTLPSYKEMKEVELTKQSYRATVNNAGI
ncbi:MAG: hypothetical protein ACR5KX_04865 [Wolbachia sp.]